MGGRSIKRGKYEKCIQGFGVNTCREDHSEDLDVDGG
jgi:hypothetical protein